MNIFKEIMFKMLKCRLIHISHNGICRRFYIQKVKYTLDIFAIRSYNKSDVFIERNSIMAVNQSIYPTFAQVKELPFYLTGIGGSEYQGQISRPEGYLWHQILYSAKGTGELRFNDQTLTVSEGRWFFLPADYPHEYYPLTACWDVRWAAFDGSACKALLEELEMTKPCVIRPESTESLCNLYNKMFIEQKSDKIYGNYICSGLIYQYILEFYHTAKSTEEGKDRSSLLMPVLNYIDDNYSKDFPMTVLAELAGITPQHLCRVFKETMHMRPNEYLIMCRLSEAKRLLKFSDIPVAEIGRQMGFSDAGYFSTVFRRHEKISPAEYRKRNREFYTNKT